METELLEENAIITSAFDKLIDTLKDEISYIDTPRGGIGQWIAGGEERDRSIRNIKEVINKYESIKTRIYFNKDWKNINPLGINAPVEINYAICVYQDDILRELKNCSHNNVDNLIKKINCIEKIKEKLNPVLKEIEEKKKKEKKEKKIKRLLLNLQHKKGEILASAESLFPITTCDLIKYYFQEIEDVIKREER